MIVVIGAPSIRPEIETGRGEPAGLAARIALAIARAGAVVQLAGRIGDDPAGDEVLLALARAGVRHDAVLRDPDRPTPLAPPGVSEGSEEPAGDDDAIGPGRVARRGPPGAVPGPVLDAADVALCLSYLREPAVIVVAEPLDPAGLAAAGAAAAFAGAALVVVVPAGTSGSEAPPGATVLEGPDDDVDDDFARLVARFAVSLDGGNDAGDAFRSALAGAGWEAVEGE